VHFGFLRRAEREDGLASELLAAGFFYLGLGELRLEETYVDRTITS
jgi:hypothetical protein